MASAHADAPVQDDSRCCSPNAYASSTAVEPSRAPTHNAWDWLADSMRSATSRVGSGLVEFKEATGAPWWLTLAAAGVGVRAVCMPVVLKAATVGSNMLAGKRSAMRHTSYLLGEPAAAAWPSQADHEARRKRLAPALAPGSTNRLWLAAPLLQARLRTRCLVQLPGSLRTCSQARSTLCVLHARVHRAHAGVL